MPGEGQDELLNVLKLLHKMFIYVIKLVCSNLEPVRKLWLLQCYKF